MLLEFDDGTMLDLMVPRKKKVICFSTPESSTIPMLVDLEAAARLRTDPEIWKRFWWDECLQGSDQMIIHTLPIRCAMQASNKIKVPVYRALRDDGLNAKWESVPAGEQHWNGNVWIFGVSVVWDLVALGLQSQ